MILCQCCIKVHFLCAGRQQPYVIRSPRRRLAVEVQLQNQLENAYNTSLILYYSKNLHFSSLSIRVNTLLFPRTRLFLIHRSDWLQLTKWWWGWNLSFAQEDGQFKIECTGVSSNIHSCNVSYPVFRSGSKVWSLLLLLNLSLLSSLKQRLNSISCTLNPILLSLILYLLLLGELYVGVWIQLHISYQ